MADLSTLSQAATQESLYNLLKQGNEAINEEALADAFVQEESLNKVRIHVSKGYIKVSLGSIKDLNIQGLSSDEKSFGEKNGNNYIVTAFNEQMKKLTSIENSLRKYRDNYSVGNSDYMNLETFEGDFFPVFEEKKQKFDEVIKEIKLIYNQEMAAFTTKVKSITGKVCPQKSIEIEKELSNLNSITADQFCDKFSMDLTTGFNLTQLSSQELRDVVAASNKAFVKRQFSAFQHGMMQELFNSLAVFYKGVNGCLTESLVTLKKTKENLKKSAIKVKRDNVGNLPFISAMTDQMMILAESSFKTIALDKAYELMSILYGKAEDLGYALETKQLPEEILPINLSDEYADIIASF